MELEYLKNYVLEGFTVPINMFEEISNYKRLNCKSPVIIINLMCLPVYAQHYEETLFGGRHEIYRKTVDDFFTKLRNAGAILEFCTIVVTESRSLHYKMRKHEEMNFILDEIYKGRSVTDTLALHDHYLHLGFMKINLPAIAKKHGDIFKAFNYQSLNYKMAEKAQILNAMAIITDTTQLWFFDVPFKQWYGRDINFENGNSTEIDRGRLLVELGLKSCHLPLLGTFLGADYKLNTRHISLKLGVGSKMKLEAIVDWILKGPEQLNRNEIYEMSKLCFSPPHQYQFTESFDYFTFNMEFEEPTEKISRFLYYENTVDNFLIVGGYTSVYDVEFFDHRKRDFDEFVDLRASLLEKKAGILLQHKNNKALKHSYYSRKEHLGDLTKSFLIPVYPKITVPSLDELLCPSDYPELNELRFFLLCWAIDEKIDKSTISRMNSKYIVDVLALYSGIKYGFIKQFEAMVILMTIDTVITGRIPEKLTYPTHLNERAMRLAFVYSNLHSEIADIVHAVGLEIETTTRFDGVFFHKLYNEWMNFSANELSKVFSGYPHLKEIFMFFK